MAGAKLEIAAKGFFAVPEQDARPLAARLREFRERLGLTQEAIAEALDLPITTYQRYERGGSEPKTDTIRALAAMGCDPTWLVTGALPSATLVFSQQQVGGSQLVAIPLYDARFSAGKGLLPPENETSRDVKLPEDWVRRVSGRSPRNLIIAQAQGDSMEPTIADGDEMLIDITDQHLTNGKIYALSVAGTLLVKRIQLSVSGITRLISDNKDYDPEDIDHRTSSEVHVIGRVVWWGHRAR